MRLSSRTFPAILSGALAIALYAVTLGGTYIYDDFGVLQMDHRLTQPRLWKFYWTQSYNGGVDNLYRPLVSMSYAIQWWLHGDRPWVFHLVNLLLHACVCACLAEFVRRTINVRAAIIAGLLFAAHPIHVEAVANIVGRAELMCALGTFAALVLLCRPITRSRALAITACFVLAILSKEQGMLLPLLILIFGGCQKYLNGSVKHAERMPAREGAAASQWNLNYFAAADVSPPSSREGKQLLTLLLCWTLAGYIIWREYILRFWWNRALIDWTLNPMIRSFSHPFGGSIGVDRVLMPLAIIGRYVSLLFFPVNLSIDYGGAVIGWHVRLTDPYLYLGTISAVSWALLLMFSFVKRNAMLVFATLSLGITYAMVGNIVSFIGTNFGERLMYLPSAFLIILITIGLAKLQPRIVIAITGIAILLGSLRTFAYARRWNDRLDFYQYTVATQPKSVRVKMLLATEYVSRGELENARLANLAALEVQPEYYDAWIQAGQIAMLQKRFDESQEDFSRAMRLFKSMKVQAWMDQLSRARAATQASQ